MMNKPEKIDSLPAGPLQRFPLNHWYVAGGCDEITREPMRRKLLDTYVVLYRKPDGGVVALDDFCPHRGYRLSASTVVGDSIQCGYHGMIFDPQGKCTSMASPGTVPNVMRVRSYPVVERRNFVWIWMGDAAKADAALIPTGMHEDDPLYDHLFHGPYPFYGNCQLAIDNLLDGTHASYLHAGMLDNEDKIEFSSPPISEVEGNIIRVTFNIKDFEPNDKVAEIFHLPKGEKFNRRTFLEVTVPCSVMIYAQFYKHNDSFDLRDVDLVSEYITEIGLTPSDRNHAFHFTALSTTFKQSQDDVELLAAILRQDIAAFGMIQEYFDEQPERAVEISVASDKLGIISRRIVQEMVRNEVG